MIRKHASPAQILVEHQRKDIGSCLCGWGVDSGDIGKSHAQHQIDILTEQVDGSLAVVLALHSLYEALYRVHGDDQVKWLTSAPHPVMEAYRLAGDALHPRRLS